MCQIIIKRQFGEHNAVYLINNIHPIDYCFSVKEKNLSHNLIETYIAIF